MCTAVEYFGAVRRHIFERSDGEVLKYDQFGAHAARIVPGQTDGAGLAGRGTRSCMPGRGRMSTIRVRSPASYWLAVPAAAWMLGVVVVPIVLLVWVSFWGGRAFSTASPLTFDNYAKFFANQTYLKLALSTIVAYRDVDGRHRRAGLLHRLLPGDEGQEPGLADWCCSWPSSSRSGPATLIRAIAWVPFLGVNGVINQALMFVGATHSPIEAFLYSRTGITMAQVSLYTMMAAGPVVYMLNADRAAAARGGDDAEGARPSSCSAASSFRSPCRAW